ncbi:MAG: serine/threonine protein kinase [Myxococcales bacterium]|nr:serine/threonine protein kinase [Myxococcales bacterium]
MGPYTHDLEAEWGARGIDFATIRVAGGTAIGTSFTRLAHPTQPAALLALLIDPSSESSQIRLAGTLGEGGMGVVRLGQQVALDRMVAVKTLKDDVDGERAAAQLLREAHVTGSLEHPNVVPIYALGCDAAGRPVIVMKRIEGRSWSQLIAAATPELRPTDEYLREQLEILIQVARATHFSHEKGILHRDIKPDNVMIGSFGEVYLVDFGIAVRSRDDGLAWLPRAQDVDSVEGTPAYMAPEMAVGSGADLGVRSDVYLLGAALHELLTGSPPHLAPTLLATLTRAFTSTAHEYPSAVPRPLVDICHRAMSRFPGDRFESAAAFEHALSEYREHRVSLRIAADAADRLPRLIELMGGGADAADEIHDLFTEIRAGFQQAVRAWSGNEAARTGLAETLERMVEHCLDTGAVESAAAHLRELSSPPAHLRERLDAQLEKKRAEEARSLQLAHDTDLSIGARDRRTFSAIAGVIWGLLCIGIGLAGRSGADWVGHATFAAVNLSFVAAITIFRLVRRETIGATAANRRLALLASTTFVVQALVWLLSVPLAMSTQATAVMHNFHGALIWGIVTFTIDPGWAWILLAHVLSTTTGLLLPGYSFEIIGGCGLFGSLAVAFGPRITAASFPTFLRESAFVLDEPTRSPRSAKASRH